MFLKGLQKTAIVSATIAILAFGGFPAQAAPVATPPGSCVGADTSGGAGSDCVTAVGHISASVVGTLTINEARALSFGNMSVGCTVACLGTSTLALNATTGARTVVNPGSTTILPLHGADATGGAANANSGGQSPGHYTVTTGAEGGTSQVYIAFADNAGNFIDYSGENYYPGNKVTLTGPGAETFTVDKFTINCLNVGSDVYGHYCDNSALPLDVAVGATLHTVAIGATTKYTAGKYTSTYDVMVSY